MSRTPALDGFRERLAARARVTAQLRDLRSVIEVPRSATSLVVMGDATFAAHLHGIGAGGRIHLLGPDSMPRRADRVTVHHAVDAEGLHRALAMIPRIGLIIDAFASPADQSARLRELLFHLWPGGVYVLARTSPESRALLDAVADIRSSAAFDPAEEASIKRVGAIAEHDPSGPVALRRFAAAVAGTEGVGSATVIQKRLLHLLKVREEGMSPAFVQARMSSWTVQEQVVPPRRVPARAALHVNRSDLEAAFFPREFDVPSLMARVYGEVICAQRQVVMRSNLLLPDTFRLIRRPYLKHDLLQDVDARFARVSGSLKDLPRLQGSYYYLDSEYPATYGHLLTDMLGRLWHWDSALAADPDLRLLVSSRKADRGRIPSWTRTALNAFGIPDERIEVLDRTTIVERLHAVTPAFVNFTYAAPELRRTWTRLRDGLWPEEVPSTPSRIFVTRPAGSSRECRNAEEVEEIFTSAGYALVRPEQHDLATQVAFFANAERIAGYGGSAMLNTIFRHRERRILVLQPDTHAAINEYLIASVHHDPIQYVYGASEMRDVPGATARDRYQSPYSVDLATDRAVLEDFAAH